MNPKHIIRNIKKHSRVGGLVIVGANECRELVFYRNAGFGPIVLFEPIPDVFQKLYDGLSDSQDINVRNYAVSDYVGSSSFFVASNSVSSSLMPLKDVIEHQKVSVDKTIEVKVTTIEESIEDVSPFTTLIIDAEGSELKILSKADALLKQVGVVCVELNYADNYEGCSKPLEVESLLTGYGFKKKLERFGDKTKAYSDALFIK